MMHLIVACILVIMCLSAAALLYLPARQHRLAVGRRIVAATGGYLQSAARRTLDRRPGPEMADVLRARLEALLRYRRGRAPHYAVSLRRVVVLALAPTLAITWLLERMLGPVCYLAAPVVWAVLIRLYYTRLETKLTGQLYLQFPDALAMIMRAVRVGVPVTEAVRMVATECQAPTTIEFRQLSDQVAIGVPLDQALRDMGARNQLAEYRFFATALALQGQTGGGLTETLETLADTIRKRVAARSRGIALASEARLSCYMLAGLPPVVCAGLYATNPSYVSVLFTTAAGNKLLALAAASLATGLFSMRTIIRKSLT